MRQQVVDRLLIAHTAKINFDFRCHNMSSHNIRSYILYGIATMATMISVRRHAVQLLLAALLLGPVAGLANPKCNPRRSFLTETAQSVAVAAGLSFLISPERVSAAVTDETENFGVDTWWTKDINSKNAAATASSPPVFVEPSDEVTIYLSKQELKLRRGLGIELSDIEFRTNLRVYVKSVTPGSLASDLGIQKGWVVVGINGQSTERTNAQGVAQMLSTAVQQTSGTDEVEFRFRDPSVFQNQLRNLQADESVTTKVGPAGDTTARASDGSAKSGNVATGQVDQTITVTQLVPPKLCRRGAQTDDLMEISYIGAVVETGAIFDGSAIKINGQGIPGRGDDVSLYLVLGKQPFGQFPPGWDVGLVGMCVGERRRLVIPPALAYGSTGMPRRGIPPNATLQYDVTLVSLNGLSTPQ
jgi:FK506-binding protein 2